MLKKHMDFYEDLIDGMKSCIGEGKSLRRTQIWLDTAAFKLCKPSLSER